MILQKFFHLRHFIGGKKFSVHLVDAERFSDCISDSTRMLDKVNDFLISLSDFLNSQGEDAGAVDMLDIYKNTILESMQESF